MSYNADLQNNNDVLRDILKDVNELPDGSLESRLSLGYHIDGLIYIFVDGKPAGAGIELPKGGISGYVDSANNIVINNLPDGTYSVKYEMADGSTVDIGSLELGAVEPEPAAPTNFAEYNSDNTSDWSIWINNARAGSDGTYRSDTESADYGTPVVSNYIAVQNGDIVEFEGICGGIKMSVAYKSDKTVLQAAVISSMTTYVSEASLDNAKYYGSFKINHANVGYIRIGGYIYTPVYPNIAIRIKRNGAYL